MIKYDKSSEELLETTFDYELWLLDFVSQAELFNLNINLDNTYIKNYENTIKRDCYLTMRDDNRVENILLHEIMPLTFVSSYKLLDMIFEWILSVNSMINGRASFKEKIKLLKTNDSILKYPPFFENYPDIKDHLFEIYKHLTNFRHEVVHNNNFEIDIKNSPMLKITSNSNTLSLKQDQLRFFVSVIVTVSKILISKKNIDQLEIMIIRYYLDQIENLHESNLYNLKKPDLFNLIWILDEKYTPKLEIGRIINIIKNKTPYIGREIIFNLVIIINNNKEDEFINAWYFSLDDIHGIKHSFLDLDKYDDKKISYKKLKSIIPSIRLGRF